MPQTIDADDDLGLSDYLRIFRQRWSWVLFPLAATLSLATALTVRQAPRYCTTAQVLIADSEAQVAIQGDANVSVANRDLANEINFAHSDTVRNQVIERLGTEPRVTIEGESDSDILLFRACGPTPDRGAAFANTWAEVYVETKQLQASENIGAAVSGFQLRLEELRTRRQELRKDVEEQLQLLAAAEDQAEQEAIRTRIELLEADLAVETDLIDAQIETIAQSITTLEMDSELARTGTARVIQLAAPPLDPANAPLWRNLVLAGLVGVVIGGGAALTADNLDRSIKSADDVIGAPVLGTIPRPDRRLGPGQVSLAAMNHSRTPVAEAYQKVRTSVEFALLGRRMTSLLITSPNQSEGKTTTSSNLAWAMSALDHRVVLADVDFRRPRLHQVFGCRIDPGLSDYLLQQVPLNRLALRVDDDRRNLVIIPTGTRPPNPADFVASPAFADLIHRLEAEADLVVLDAPPVLPVSDALSIARQVDAVIVVAKAGSTGRDQLAESLAALRSVGADVLGVCLVGVKADPSRYGYGAPTEPSRRRQPRRSQPADDTDRRTEGATASDRELDDDELGDLEPEGPDRDHDLRDAPPPADQGDTSPGEVVEPANR